MVLDGDSPRDAFGGEPKEIVEVLRQDVVADVQATSRHGGAADTAHVRSTLLLTDGRHLTTATQIPVFEVDDHFTLSLHVPPAFARIVDGGVFTILVLLPASTDTYETLLSDYSSEYDPQVHDLNGRIGIGWRGTGSGVDTIYQLIPIGGR